MIYDPYNRSQSRSGRESLQNIAPSQSKVEANNYKLIREWADAYDMSCNTDNNTVCKIQENFEIHSGRWAAIENISPNPKITIGQEDIELGSGTLKHYPVIDRVSKTIASDLMIRPLIIAIRDYSSRARNFRERARLERVKSYFQETLIEPQLAQLRMEWDIKNGVIDPLNIPEEAMQQKEADVLRALKDNNPEEIMYYMNKYSTPDETIAHALTNYTVKINNSKHQFDLGGEMSLASGSEFHRVGIVNRQPYHKVLNPKWVTYMPSQDSINCEDGIFARYENYISPEEVIAKYGLDLKWSDLKKIAKNYGRIPGSGLLKTKEDSDRRFDSGIESKVLDIIDNDPELRVGLDIKSQEGQSKMQFLYKQINNRGSNMAVRDAYITFRMGRQIKLVMRQTKSGGYNLLIRNGSYVMSPEHGDVKTWDKMTDWVMEADKLGQGSDAMYFNVKPRAGQFNDFNKPFNPKLGIFGGEDNTIFHNVKNNSLIDLGKPWQYRFNVVMKRMDDHMATDIGNVFLGTTTMFPQDWTYADFYRSMFVGRTALVSTHKEGVGGNDMQYFKTLDMGRQRDIEGDIRQLEYMENKIYSSMYYSKEKIGQISPYATNENIRQSVTGVDKQMYRFFNRRREVKQNVLNQLMQLSLISYRHNEEVKNTVLDDFSKVHYEKNFNEILSSNFNLHVVDDFKESEKLEKMRELALTLLQNGLSGKEVSGVINAETIHELEEILEQGDRRRAEQAEAEQASLQQLEETKAANQERQLQLMQEFQMALNERNNEVKLALGELNSQVMENAADVDKNKENDAIQRVKIEIKGKEREVDKKLAFEKYKFDNTPKSKK